MRGLRLLDVHLLGELLLSDYILVVEHLAVWALEVLLASEVDFESFVYRDIVGEVVVHLELDERGGEVGAAPAHA